MSAFLKANFGELAPCLADFGYQPVPIQPGGKKPVDEGWQTPRPPEHYLPQRARWGTGILCATCPAIDLDVRDKELVRALIQIADDAIGPPPFRIGSPPKALLPFTTDAPFDKLSGRWFALPGDDWRDDGYLPHRIEVLGKGQQFLTYARHPRGTFYKWRRGGPMQIYRIDLPEIDQASAQTFLWTAQAVIREAGATPLERREKVWFPAPWRPGDFGEPQPTTERRRSSGGRFDSSWQRLDPETLAKRIDAKHARQLKNGGWITSCPAHVSAGNRSLSITPRNGGGSLVHCFGECRFCEVARAIADVLGDAA